MNTPEPSQTPGGGSAEPLPWERRLIEKIVMSSQLERRRARRWGILFKLLTFAYLGAFLWLLFPAELTEKVKKAGQHTALVDVKGIIAPETRASADNIVKGLREAFESENTKGVIIRINSPGGSPVQAGQINDEIRRLRDKYPEIPVYAVVTDICASGGYYIAVAADEIYADKASIVGSIGVLMNGFGFEGALEKLGIERRLLTAGQHKGILDPFSPLSNEDREFVQGVLDKLHAQFISAVRQGRGDRLKGRGEEIFSGLFWNGEESLELGLIDALRSPGQVAREVIGVEEIVDFTPKKDLWDELTERLGTGALKLLGRSLESDSLPHLR